MDGRDIRPRTDSELHVDASGLRYTLSEWTFVSSNAVVSLQFLVGSVLFFSWLKPWAMSVGDALFVTGSLQCFVMWTARTIDHQEEIRRATEEADQTMDKGNRDHALKELDERRLELLESVCYLISSIVFMAGCVLFYPRLFTNNAHRILAQRVAAYLFVSGSLGFVLAACWSAASLVKRIAVEEACCARSDKSVKTRLMAWEVVTSLLGSVLFVVGSVLYRPVYSASCNHQTIVDDYETLEVLADKNNSMPLAHGIRHRGLRNFLSSARPAYLGPEPGMEGESAKEPMPADLRVLCVNLMNIGSLLYVIGSSILLVRCLISFIRLALADQHKHAGQVPGTSASTGFGEVNISEVSNHLT